MELNSEEILPVNERVNPNLEEGKGFEIIPGYETLFIKTLNYIGKYHKALEAAELQIVQLQDNYDELLRRYTLDRELHSNLIKSAETRYNKAWKFFTLLDNIEKDLANNVDNLLKIAAGLTTNNNNEK